MKLKKYLLSFSILLLGITNSHACDVINGSDIKFNHLGGYRYHIKYILYHQCVCKLGIMPVFTVSCGATSITRTPLRTSIRDITPVCSSGQPPCQNGGYNGSRYGIEEHIFEDTIDFAQSPFSVFLNGTCCEVMFRVRQPWGLVGTTTSTTSYGGEAMMNFCAIGKKGNYSPTLSNIPISFMCCNQPFTFNNGIFDNNDYDSLGYELDEPLSSTFMPVTWIMPLNKDIPLTPYCPPNPGTANCRALPNAKPPRGFYFDKETGDMVITPVKCDESGPIAIRVTEYRKDSASKKMVKIGYVRRDIYVTVVQCGDNNPPQITGNNKFSVCEGKKICFTIGTFDSMMRPKQSVPDTVTLTWNHAIPGATFTILDTAAREKQAEFCWQTKYGDARNQAYSFTATAKDDACPRPAYTIKGYNIVVKPTARDTRKYDVLECGKLRFEAFPKDTVNYNKKNYTYKFTIRDSTNSGVPVYFGYKNKDSIKFKRGGKYIIEHEINNPPLNCPTIYTDTVRIPPVLDVELAFGKDTFVCAGNSLTLEPTVSHGIPSYTYKWSVPPAAFNAKDTLQKYTLVKPTTHSTVILTLTDKKKCVDSDTIRVKYQPNPVVNIGPDQRICTYQDVTLDAQNADTMRYYWQPNGDSTRKITVSVAGKYIAKVIDHLGCNTSDTMQLFVNDTVVAIAKPNREICINDTLKIKALRKPRGYARTITWRDIGSGVTVATDSAFNLKITTMTVRNYEMYLKVIQGGVTCEDKDTFNLIVNALPTFAFKGLPPRCYADGAVNLTTNNIATAYSGDKSITEKTIRYFQQFKKPSWITGGPVGVNTFVYDFQRFVTNAQVPKAGLADTICYEYRDYKGCYNKECKPTKLNPNPIVELKDGVFCQKAGKITLDKLVVKPFSKVGGIQGFRVISVPNSSGVDPTTILTPNYSVVPNTTEMDPGMEGENEKTGDYAIEYCFKDVITGCQSCDTSIVSVIRLPEIQFSNMPKQCVNNPLLALDSFVNDRNSEKRFPDGQWSAIEYSGSRDMSNMNVRNKINNSVKFKKYFDPTLGAGQYLLKFIDSSSGCPVTDSTEILVNGLPIIDIDVPDTVCSAATPFTLNNIQPSGSVGVWSGKGVTGRDFDPSSSAKAKQYEGPVMLKYIYTNPLTGCTASDSESLLIQTLPEIKITNTRPYQQCEGKIFEMNSTSKWIKNIEWSTNGDGSFADKTKASNAYTHGLNDTALVALAGNVTLTVSTIKEGVCPVVKDNITLLIEPYPQFTMPPHMVACEAAEFGFSSTVIKPAGSPNLKYTWWLGNGDTLKRSANSAPQNIKYDTAKRGWYDVVLIVHNQWGAEDFHSCDTRKDSMDYVRVLPQPKAGFSSDPKYFTTVAYPRFKFFNETKVRWGWDSMKYLWNFDHHDVDDTSTKFNPLKSYKNDTLSYWVNLTSVYRYIDPVTQEEILCWDSLGQPRKIGPDVTVFVPTAFSPEGTGPKENNKFRPVVNGEKTFHIQIFNRWGEMLWETHDKYDAWDGKYRGEDAQQDVYAWHVKVTAFDGEEYKYEGTVTLLR